MPKYKIGDRVIDVTSERKGIVVSVAPPSRGRQGYMVNFAGCESDESVLESFLKEDYDISDPFERCKSHVFGSYTDFARINTAYKITNSSNSTIASLKASKTVFKAYQFKPLLKFLNSENRRLLVADEVGLGKTIEAGHILMELQARRELRNALIVCPKSLCTKWQAEMQEKFGLPFKIYTTANDLREDIRLRAGSFRAIVNYERFQAPSKRRAEDPNHFLNIIKESNILFSIVLCDEAHKVRNASTATYSGIEQLAQIAQSMVMLTATPIMISDENLYNLLHILAPIQYDNSIEFHNSLSLNQPFLQALRELRTKKTLPEIAATLAATNIHLAYRFYTEDRVEYYRTQQVNIADYYASNLLYQRCIETMQKGEDTTAVRVKLQWDLTSLSELNNIFSRTRRREVTTDMTQAERHPFRIPVPLEKKEREVFDDIINQYIDDNSYTDMWGEEHLDQGAALGLVSKKRQVASSVYAYLNDWEDLNAGIDAYAECPDAKITLLKDILDEVFNTNKEKKLILFANFKKTLRYLKIRLEKMGYQCALIYGGIDNRDEELKRFKNDPDVQILLSSEVGSEGLDMQFCCSMVNYDLPWNPMVVEQRIGRIDRFGQKSKVVKIYNLVVKNSIQEDIYDRLLDRIGIFRESIGDLEAILDAPFQGTDTIQKAYIQLEKELFSNELTIEEQHKKEDDISQAIENVKRQVQEIEDSQTNTLTVDTYYQNEVNRILTTHSYLTDNELRAFISLLIEKELPQCSLEHHEDGTDLFVLPKSNPRCLLNFVFQYIEDGEERVRLAEFRRQTEDKTEFLITFNQEVAYDRPDVIYVNIQHPIVLAATRYFEKHRNATERTFFFDVARTLLPSSLKESSYFLAIYSITTRYRVQSALKETTTQYPILYDWHNGQVVSNQDDVYRMMGQSQVYGLYHSTADIASFSDEVIEDLRYSLMEEIAKYKQGTIDDLKVTLQSQRDSKLAQMEKYHTYQEMARLEDQLRHAQEVLRHAWTPEDIKNADSRVKAVETRMANIESEYQEKRRRLMSDFDLTIEPPVLVSLNLINIV